MTEQSEALVERLRENGRWYVDNKFNLPLRAAAAIEALQAREAALRAENATLAAGSCDVPGGKVGDEHGHFYCTLERELAAAKEQAERLAAVLVELVEQCWRLEKDMTEFQGHTFCGESLPLCNARAALAAWEKSRG